MITFFFITFYLLRLFAWWLFHGLGIFLLIWLFPMSIWVFNCMNGNTVGKSSMQRVCYRSLDGIQIQLINKILEPLFEFLDMQMFKKNNMR